MGGSKQTAPRMQFHFIFEKNIRESTSTLIEEMVRPSMVRIMVLRKGNTIAIWRVAFKKRVQVFHVEPSSHAR